MKIIVEKFQNEAIIKLTGNITGIPDDTEFNNTINELIKKNIKNIVVDFGNISYVNSTGLGIILRGYQTIKAAGGDMKISSLNKKMQSLIELTKINTIFDVYDSSVTALKNFD